jgi:hypothetical protein
MENSSTNRQARRLRVANEWRLALGGCSLAPVEAAGLPYSKSDGPKPRFNYGIWGILGQPSRRFPMAQGVRLWFWQI